MKLIHHIKAREMKIKSSTLETHSNTKFMALHILTHFHSDLLPKTRIHNSPPSPKRLNDDVQENVSREFFYCVSRSGKNTCGYCIRVNELRIYFILILIYYNRPESIIKGT